MIFSGALSKICHWRAGLSSEPNFKIIRKIFTPLHQKSLPLSLKGRQMPASQLDIFCHHGLLSHFSRVRLCATQRRQPTRLPHPWDSPGKITGVGCHFLLQCIKVKSESEVTQSCPTLSRLCSWWEQPTRLLRPWDFPGKSTGVGRHCLLHIMG